jgi:hypothetical protein
MEAYATAAVLAERAACAKLCDDYSTDYPLTQRNARANRRAARVLSDAIRARTD